MTKEEECVYFENEGEPCNSKDCKYCNIEVDEKIVLEMIKKLAEIRRR